MLVILFALVFVKVVCFLVVGFVEFIEFDELFEFVVFFKFVALFEFVIEGVEFDAEFDVEFVVGRFGRIEGEIMFCPIPTTSSLRIRNVML